MNTGIKHWSELGMASMKRSMAALARLPRVMVVEDNPSDAEFFLELLKEFDCEVTFCDSERAAITTLKDTPHDLVFLDLKLASPGSGLGIMAAAAGLPQRVSFVVVTGCIQSPEVMRALELGAVAVLEKPPTREQMVAIFGKIKN